VPLRPRIEEVALAVTIDGVEHRVQGWTDMTALQVVREVLRHPDVRWRCEAGLCGTCEALLDGVPTRLCTVSCTRLDGAAVELPER